jgi:hypothetical protein
MRTSKTGYPDPLLSPSLLGMRKSPKLQKPIDFIVYYLLSGVIRFIVIKHHPSIKKRKKS